MGQSLQRTVNAEVTIVGKQGWMGYYHERMYNVVRN